MENGPVTLAEDSGLFDSTPAEVGASLVPPSESAHEVALFDSPAASEGSSTAPSDEETGLFGDANGSDPSSEETHASDTDPAGPHAGNTRRASGGRRNAKAERGRFHAPAKLAAAVGKLRKYEDTIADSVVAADQLVRRLESRGVHADAGYPSPSDFECRILSATPLLKGLREGLAASQAKRARGATGGARGSAGATSARGSAGATSARGTTGTRSANGARGAGASASGAAAATRGANGDRARKTKALKSMATAFARLRELDVTVQDAALGAAEVFEAIEAERLFEECGYLTFEEFLERALGPSPVLASAVALAEFEPPLTPEEEPAEEAAAEAIAPNEPSNEAASLDAFASALEEGPGLGGRVSKEAPAEDAPMAMHSAALDDEIIEIPGARKALSFPAQLVLMLVLCLAATFGGGAAGSWSVLHALAQVENPESVDSANSPAPSADEKTPHAPQKARPSAAASGPTRNGKDKGEHEIPGSSREGAPQTPKREGAREPQASKNAPAEIDPLAIPVVLPHPRASGPREARR
jgi:hypothetical protein